MRIFLKIGVLSKNMFIWSLKDGIAIHKFPSSDNLILSGYPIKLSIIISGFAIPFYFNGTFRILYRFS